MPGPAPGFEVDIRPLFREVDVRSMTFAFDLSSHEGVCQHAEDIYERLADGTMPCDGAWPDNDVARFRDWVDSGMAP